MCFILPETREPRSGKTSDTFWLCFFFLNYVYMQNPGRLHLSFLLPGYVLLIQKDLTSHGSYKQLFKSELMAVHKISKICPWSSQLALSKGGLTRKTPVCSCKVVSGFSFEIKHSPSDDMR